MKFNIVLVHPQIPPNTGNIVRLCAATNSKLHLIKPLGFSIDDKQMKRAGLDYWEQVEIEIHENIDDFLEKYPQVAQRMTQYALASYLGMTTQFLSRIRKRKAKSETGFT